MALVAGNDERVLVELDLDAVEALLHVAEREHLGDGPAASCVPFTSTTASHTSLASSRSCVETSTATPAP